MTYPLHLIKLIQALRRLPGVGAKTAERFAFQMLDWQPKQLHETAELLTSLKERITNCKICGCICDVKCRFCESPRGQPHTLCIVGSSRDVFAIEETGEYRGHYHVLGSLLSPMQGLGPEHLNIDTLRKRVTIQKFDEIIIALDSTLEGDATSLYLKQELDLPGVKISRLAFGLPMGSSLDYVDGGTLARAFMGRGQF